MRAYVPAPTGSIRTEAIGDPAFVVDSAGIVTSWNAAAETFFNRKAADVVGLRCPAVVGACLPTGESVCSADCPLIQGFGINPGPPAVDLVVKTGDPSRRRRRATVQHIPLTDSAGRPTGLLHIVVPETPDDPRPPNGLSADELEEVAGTYLG